MKLYVASSWRNSLYSPLLSLLRTWGHDCYDFRENGFGWENIYPDWNHEEVPSDSIVDGLWSREAIMAFDQDMAALKECDGLVLCLPCGAAAHSEFGWAVGKGKTTVVVLPYDDPIKPELMWNMADLVTRETDELRKFLA